jgi:hypothetical protein
MSLDKKYFWLNSSSIFQAQSMSIFLNEIQYFLYQNIKKMSSKL